MKEELKSKFDDQFRKFDDWWTAYCLYLDPVSREKLRLLNLEVGMWVAGHETYLTAPPETRFREAWIAVQKGIGLKHIDTRIIEGDRPNTRESPDDL